MFDIGWTELVVVAIVAILVVGPKDLPGMLRSTGRMVSNLRRMARDFQRQFDDALREAELDDVKKIAQAKSFKPLDEARKTIQDTQNQVRSALTESGESKNGDPPQDASTNGAARASEPSADAKSPAKASRAARKTSAKPAGPAGKKPAAKRAGPDKPAASSARAKRGKKATATTAGNSK